MSDTSEAIIKFIRSKIEDLGQAEAIEVLEDVSEECADIQNAMVDDMEDEDDADAE